MTHNVFRPITDIIYTYIYSLSKYLRAYHVPAANLNKAVAFKFFPPATHSKKCILYWDSIYTDTQKFHAAILEYMRCLDIFYFILFFFNVGHDQLN